MRREEVLEVLEKIREKIQEGDCCGAQVMIVLLLETMKLEKALEDIKDEEEDQ